MRKKNINKSTPTWSLGFILASLGNFFLLALVFLLLIFSPNRLSLSYESKVAFFVGIFISMLIILSSELRKLRTIIHEMKHAVVALLTGNKVKKIVANKDDGFVEYEMLETQLHFAPIIALAPYFFPFLSLPALIGSILYEFRNPVECSFILGLSVSADICFGIGEIHPKQSDFKQVGGGIFLSKLYLAGFYLLWPSLVYLWIKSGYKGLEVGIKNLGEFLISTF